MKYKELVDAIAAKSGLSKADAQKAVEATVDVVGEALVAKDKVSIPGFGSFEASVRAARKGRNPTTGAEIDVPEKTVAKFKAAKALEDKVNA